MKKYRYRLQVDVEFGRPLDTHALAKSCRYFLLEAEIPDDGEETQSATPAWPFAWCSIHDVQCVAIEHA